MAKRDGRRCRPLESFDREEPIEFMKSRIAVVIFGIILLPALILAQDKQQSKYDESFDPLKLKEPKPEFFSEESQESLSREINSGNFRAEKITGEEQQQEVTGYRVQLIATPNYQEADTLFENVKETFGEDVDAYLVYDSPNYKIRLGDFENRIQAEALLNRVKREGYRYAWIVRSSIREE